MGKDQIYISYHKSQYCSSPFTFSVITDMVGIWSAILVFVFYFSHVFFNSSPPPFLPSFVLNNYF